MGRGVGCGIGRLTGRRPRLGRGKAHGMGARQFAGQRALVDIGRDYARCGDAKPTQQLAATRTGRGQNEFGLW